MLTRPNLLRMMKKSGKKEKSSKPRLNNRYKIIMMVEKLIKTRSTDA